MTKNIIKATMEELVNNGMTYIGNVEIMGSEYVCKKYKKLAKEVEKNFHGMVLAFDIESGNAWLA